MVKRRKYEVKDHDRVIDFFREIYREDPSTVYWLPQRWEYADKLVGPLHQHRGIKVDWKETIYLWEADGSEIVSVLCSEYPDENITIHTKREYRSLEEEMVKFAEERVIREVMDKPGIKVRAREGDEMREAMLKKLGYEKLEETEYLNWRDLAGELPGVIIPKGYTIRDMTDEKGLDLQKKIDRITGAFESQTYPEKIYRDYQKSNFYKKEYDLYTTDAKGEVASFCIVWFDPQLNTGYFEPVGTDAGHRGKGLAKAVLTEGLKRLKQDGVETAYVGAANDNLMKFYKASGFDRRTAFRPWYKKLV